MSALLLPYEENDVTATNISQSLPDIMAYNGMKKLCHCHPMYWNCLHWTRIILKLDALTRIIVVVICYTRYLFINQ